MKICFNVLFLLILALFFNACASPQTNLIPLTATASKTDFPVTETVSVTMTRPVAVPPLTATPSPKTTVRPTVTHIVIIESTKAPEALTSSLTVQTLDAFNGHATRRISGWVNGFNSFGWMDSNHVLLYPIINFNYSEGAGVHYASYPTVIHLNSGRVWFPISERLTSFPLWSSKLGALVFSESGLGVEVYGPDGDLQKTYAGNLISISPSRTKILTIEEHSKVTWLDLLTGKQVSFLSQNVSSSDTPAQPIWSSDETRFYTNLHVYGNAKTGEVFDMPGLILDGEQSGAYSAFQHVSGKWLLNDTYLITLWSAGWDWPPKFLTIFDPAMKSYRNLNKLAGIPYDPTDGNYYAEAYPCDTFGPSAQEGGRYVWLQCKDGDRLIDLKTFKSTTFPDIIEARLDWSADGSFAFVRVSNRSVGILSGPERKVKPLPEDNNCLDWHPIKNIFLCLADNGQELFIFDAQRMSVQNRVKLSVNIKSVYWNAVGRKILLVANDGSLWQVNEARLDHLEQLTDSMEGAQLIRFSDDGKFVAFMVGLDVYIVNLQKDS